MAIWEIRCLDGRGASLFTNDDVSVHLSSPGTVRQIEVALGVSSESQVGDALDAFARGNTATVFLKLDAVAYTVKHEPA